MKDASDGPRVSERGVSNASTNLLITAAGADFAMQLVLAHSILRCDPPLSTDRCRDNDMRVKDDSHGFGDGTSRLGPSETPVERIDLGLKYGCA